jgi:hypothetical protein
VPCFSLDDRKCELDFTMCLVPIVVMDGRPTECSRKVRFLRESRLNILYLIDKGGHAVAQLVEALRYMPEGRGFESRWCHCHNLFGIAMALGSTQPLT